MTEELFSLSLPALVEVYQRAGQDYYHDPSSSKERLLYGGVCAAIGNWRFGPEAWGNAVLAWHRAHAQVPRRAKPSSALTLEDLDL